MKLTEAEWVVLEILWSGDRFALKDITNALKDTKSWNKNTVYTYLRLKNILRKSPTASKNILQKVEAVCETYNLKSCRIVEVLQ